MRWAMVVLASMSAGCDDGTGNGLDGAGGIAGAGGEGGVGGEAGAGSAGGGGGQSDVDECWRTATNDGDCAAPSGGRCGSNNQEAVVRCSAPGELCRDDLRRETGPGGLCGAGANLVGTACDDDEDCGDNPRINCSRDREAGEKFCKVFCIDDAHCPADWFCVEADNGTNHCEPPA